MSLVSFSESITVTMLAMNLCVSDESLHFHDSEACHACLRGVRTREVRLPFTAKEADSISGLFMRVMDVYVEPAGNPYTRNPLSLIL